MEVKNILYGFCLISAIHASNDSGGQMMINATLPVQGMKVIQILEGRIEIYRVTRLGFGKN